MFGIALYIHIPFCSSKCDYCDFYSFKTNDEQLKKQFEEALFSEIEVKKELLKNKKVTSIYVGGGTPSVMPPDFFKHLKKKLGELCEFDKNLEFTVEVNPSSVSEQLVSTLKDVGVNRISVGFQCANDRILKYVHRSQTFAQFENALNIINKYFDNVSIDIMTALPYEKMSDVKLSLKKALKFRPKHISVYSLTVFENTPLFNKKHVLSFIPNEKQQVKMLSLCDKFLAKKGFDRYEVSNYAKRCREDEKKFASNHNLVYWQGGDYLGFGPSAASFVSGVRLTNEKNLKNYLDKNFNADREVLTGEQIRLEKIMLGLRTKWGCEKRLCKNENLPFLIKNKYVKVKDDRIVATKKGLNVLNIIIDKLT